MSRKLKKEIITYNVKYYRIGYGKEIFEATVDKATLHVLLGNDKYIVTSMLMRDKKSKEVTK